MNKLRHRQYERGVRAALGVIDEYTTACKRHIQPAHSSRTWEDRANAAAALADRILSTPTTTPPASPDA